MNFVDFYLSQESYFTYSDLEKLKRTSIVSRPWQVKYWFAMIHRRLENRYRKIPENFEVEGDASRWTYHNELRKQMSEEVSVEFEAGNTIKRKSETVT